MTSDYEEEEDVEVQELVLKAKERCRNDKDKAMVFLAERILELENRLQKKALQ